MNNPARINCKAIVCMTTYNRIDCARINQEIIKLNYRQPFPVVHACSSPFYQGYLEDVLDRCEQQPLSQASSIATLQNGALNLLQRSVAKALEHYAPEYIVHLEGDTWIMNEDVIHAFIIKMEKNSELMLCTSAWDEDHFAFEHQKRPCQSTALRLRIAKLLRRFGHPWGLKCRDSLATQFFIMRTDPRMIDCLQTLQTIPGLDLEQAFYRKFMAIFSEHNILRQYQREPIHPYNRFVCKKLSLYSQHWPARGTPNDKRSPTHPRYIAPTIDGKRETLEEFSRIRNGENIQRLLNATSFDYYNVGAART